MAATPEEFTHAAVARLRQLTPPPAVEVTGALELVVTLADRAPATLRLHNLWWAHLADPGQLRDRLDQLAVGLTSAAADAPLEPERLVPVVRGRAAFPASAPTQPLAGRLHVGVALDGQVTRRLVRRIDADLLRMPESRLFLVARANLGLRAGTLRREALGPVTRLHFDGDLDSSLLVLKPLWQAVARAVGEPVLACASNRGALLYAPSAAATQLRHTARQLRRMAPWPLPLELLLWTGEGWRAVESGTG